MRGGARHEDGLQGLVLGLVMLLSAEEGLLGVCMEKQGRELLSDSSRRWNDSGRYLGNHVITEGYYWCNIVDNLPA